MPRDECEIRRLLEEGISQEVSAEDFNGWELARMVESALEGNTTLYIRNSDQLDEWKIERIAEEGKRNVVFR